jgi:hypothetical protein
MPTKLCRVCHWRRARPGRRDARCPTCAAYYHRYGRDRSPELVVRHGRRLLERRLTVW